MVEITLQVQYLLVVFEVVSFLDILKSVINQTCMIFMTRIRFSHVKFTTNSAAVNQVFHCFKMLECMKKITQK